MISKQDSMIKRLAALIIFLILFMSCWPSLSVVARECEWIGITDSHQLAGDYDWCPRGYAITAFDLDSLAHAGNIPIPPFGSFEVGGAASDSPVIGSVRCCELSDADRIEGWDCWWEEIGSEWSHYASEGYPSMCPQGSYMTAIDQDSDSSIGEDVSPIIGRVRCCRPSGPGIGTWTDSFWKEVGYSRSAHQTGDWCSDRDSYVVSVDLDAHGGDEMDSPYVGKCECSLGKSVSSYPARPKSQAGPAILWGATLYEHANYGGKSRTFSGDTPYVGDDFNDIASSLKVPPGYWVVLYEHSNYGGKYKVFSADTTYVGNDFNDITSSLKLVPASLGASSGLGSIPWNPPPPEPAPITGGVPGFTYSEIQRQLGAMS